MPTGLSAPVSTRHSRHPSPTAFFSVPLSHSLTGVPSPLPVTPRLRVQNPLSGFAPKQTKKSSAWRTIYLVLHLYSTTDILSVGSDSSIFFHKSYSSISSLLFFIFLLESKIPEIRISNGFDKCYRIFHCPISNRIYIFSDDYHILFYPDFLSILL